MLKKRYKNIVFNPRDVLYITEGNRELTDDELEKVPYRYVPLKKPLQHISKDEQDFDLVWSRSDA